MDPNLSSLNEAVLGCDPCLKMYEWLFGNVLVHLLSQIGPGLAPAEKPSDLAVSSMSSVREATMVAATSARYWGYRYLSTSRK